MTEFIVLHNMSDGRQDRQGKRDHARNHSEKKKDHFQQSDHIYTLSNKVMRTFAADVPKELKVNPDEVLVAVNV